jgi:hypothetical protein
MRFILARRRLRSSSADSAHLPREIGRDADSVFSDTQTGAKPPRLALGRGAAPCHFRSVVEDLAHSKGPDMTSDPHRFSPNRRRCVVVASALACLVLADILVRHTDVRLRAFYVNTYERKLGALSDRSPKPEIILMGSSRAKYGLVPAEFERLTGLRAFNLGIPASKTLEWQKVAQRLLERMTPSLVVLGVNASIVRADYLPVPAARDLWRFDDFAAYCGSDGWSGEIAGHYIVRNAGAVWRLYHDRFELRLLAQERLGFILPKHAQLAAERRTRVSKPLPPDGFEHPWLYGRRLRNLQVLLDEDGPANVQAAGTPAYSPDAKAVAHFDTLLGMFRARGVPVIVAYVPNSPRTEERWKDVEPAMIDILENVCRDNGVPFVSCSQADLPRTDADYLEELHAGLPLAKRISRRIAGRITALGLLEGPQRHVARVEEGCSIGH